MKTLLITASAAALAATMSVALAQTPKGEGGQKEMSQPTSKENAPGEKGAGKTGEQSVDKKGGQEKTADTPKGVDKTGKKEAGADSDKKAKDKSKNQRKEAAEGDKNGKQATKNAEQEGTGKTNKAEGKGQSGSASLTSEQRTKVQSSFARHKQKSANINISVNVGVAVPRSVKLYAIPQDIVVIVPTYRRYRYFVVGDRICIVDPGTYEIVEVILIT
jgi:hypothetical protein